MNNYLRILSTAVLAVAATLCHAETGVTANEIVLGQSAALSGPAGELGTQMRDGALAYFKTVNDQGGVYGRKIKLISLDDGYESARAEANTKELISKDNVFSLFGYVGTPTSNAAKPVFTAARVPFFGPLTGAESMRKPLNHYIFNVRSSYGAETDSIITFLGPAHALKTAVFYQNDAYGQAGLAGVKAALAKFHATPIALGTVERNTVDVKAAVDSIGKAAPDDIIMIGAYKPCAEFIRQMKARLPGVSFWNVSFVGSRALSSELGETGRGVGISQVVPFPWDDVTPVTKEHHAALGTNMSFTTLEGYIAAKVFVEGLRKAGKNLTREGLIATLEGAGKIDVGGFNVKYSPESHDGSQFVDLTLISHGGRFIR